MRLRLRTADATTCALGINNRGQVVGQYVDAASVLHGYLWQRALGFETIDVSPVRAAVGNITQLGRCGSRREGA